MKRYNGIDWISKMDIWHTEGFNSNCSLFCMDSDNYWKDNFLISIRYDTSCIFTI